MSKQENAFKKDDLRHGDQTQRVPVIFILLSWNENYIQRQLISSTKSNDNDEIIVKLLSRV